MFDLLNNYNDLKEKYLCRMNLITNNIERLSVLEILNNVSDSIS